MIIINLKVLKLLKQKTTYKIDARTIYEPVNFRLWGANNNTRNLNISIKPNIDIIEIAQNSCTEILKK